MGDLLKICLYKCVNKWNLANDWIMVPNIKANF